MKDMLYRIWEYFLVSIISIVIIVLGYGALAFFWALGLFFRLTRRR